MASGRSRARDRARYLAEAERRREYARRYHYANRDEVRSGVWRRKAQRAGVRIFQFTARDWHRLVRRYRGACAYCGRMDLVLQPDHVIALARGGSHGAGNIVPSCPPCNTRKRTKFVVEWHAGRRERRAA